MASSVVGQDHVQPAWRGPGRRADTPSPARVRSRFPVASRSTVTPRRPRRRGRPSRPARPGAQLCQPGGNSTCRPAGSMAAGIGRTRGRRWSCCSSCHTSLTSLIHGLVTLGPWPASPTAPPPPVNAEVAPDPIRFRLLGQVEAWRAGERVELGGRKQRAVLASPSGAGRPGGVARPAHRRPVARAPGQGSSHGAGLRLPTSARWSRTAAQAPVQSWSRRRRATARDRVRLTSTRRVRPARRAGARRARRRRPSRPAGVAPRGGAWRTPRSRNLPDAPFARAEAGPASTRLPGSGAVEDRVDAETRAAAGRRADRRARAAGAPAPMRNGCATQFDAHALPLRPQRRVGDLPGGAAGACATAGAGARGPAAGARAGRCCSTTRTWREPQPR